MEQNHELITPNKHLNESISKCGYVKYSLLSLQINGNATFMIHVIMMDVFAKWRFFKTFFKPPRSSRVTLEGNSRCTTS